MSIDRNKLALTAVCAAFLSSSFLKDWTQGYDLRIEEYIEANDMTLKTLDAFIDILVRIICLV